MSFELNGKVYETDKFGYLENARDWDLEVADYIAKQVGITMTGAHWEIIGIMRSYYERYGMSPSLKALVNTVAKKLGANKGCNLYLYELFPDGPAGQGCKIAGLPKPLSCI